MMKRVLMTLLLTTASLQAQVSFDRLLRADGEPQNWLMYSGTFKGHRYSELRQITPDNVRNLEPSGCSGAIAGEFEATRLSSTASLHGPTAQRSRGPRRAGGRVYWVYSHRPSQQARLCCGRVNRGLAILDCSHGYDRWSSAGGECQGSRLIWDVALARPEAGYPDARAAGRQGQGGVGPPEVNTAFAASSRRSMPKPARKCGGSTPSPERSEPSRDTWGGDS
jgi:alcohol dehydrogenase (cytochrome c)